MSRGPGAKGAPDREGKKKMKNRKEKTGESGKEKKKEEMKKQNETFQIPGPGPHPIYPHESK